MAQTVAPKLVELQYTPHERQRVFHESTADEVLWGGSAGPGKMLRLDTPVPTPEGWTTVGELQPGDVIFTELGEPTMVLAISSIDPAPVSYRLTFDDDSTVDCCADHLWLTYDIKELGALTRRDPAWRAARRGRRKSRVTGRKSEAFTRMMLERNQRIQPPTIPAPTGSVRTTLEIAQTLRVGARLRTNHAVPVARPLLLPRASDLSLNPYLLGLWLGDGHSYGGTMTSADPEILGAFEDEGFQVKAYAAKYQYGIKGLTTILRDLGLIRNKHIPPEYLRASLNQRLDLLQGLMDTDGSADPHGGDVEFVSTNPRLANQVYELATSLGQKVRLAEGRAKLNGRDVGPKWRINWTSNMPMFRLSRKREIQRLATRRTTQFRYIVGCKPIPSVPMRCIAVENPSGLFLVGRQMVPTHNSLGLLMEMFHQAMEQPGCQVILFRKTFPQLENTLIKGSLEGFPGPGRPGQFPFNPGDHYNMSKHTWSFPNGSKLRFGHAQHGYASVLLYQGDQWEGFGVDELTEWEESAYRFLFTRLRTTSPKAWPRVRNTTNPIGIGFQWCRDRFVQPYLEGLLPYDTPFTPDPTDEDPEPMSRAFIPAKHTDNPTLMLADPGYIGRLKQLPARERVALLEGSWDLPAFEGQLFQPDILASMAEDAIGLELSRWECGKCQLDWNDPTWVKQVDGETTPKVVLQGATVWMPEIAYDAMPTCKVCGNGLTPHRYLTAWDLAKAVDWTVGITADVSVEPHQIVAFERFKRAPWPEVARKIEQRWACYPGATYIDSTGVGDPILDFLKVPVKGMLFSSKSKTDMVQALIVLLERGGVKAPLRGQGIEQLWRELSVYTWDDKKLTQDCVMAMSMLAFQVPRADDLGISL